MLDVVARQRLGTFPHLHEPLTLVGTVVVVILLQLLELFFAHMCVGMSKDYF